MNSVGIEFVVFTAMTASGTVFWDMYVCSLEDVL